MSSDKPPDNSPKDNDESQADNTQNGVDRHISLADSRKYWAGVSATNNGMLGGFEDLVRPDLKQSKRFIGQVRRILQRNPPRKIERVVDCGAGIGRITKGLLVHVADTVDVVEPIAKFADEVANSEYVESGQVADIFIEGLESWIPPVGRKYGLIWNQWCLGHLTDVQLVDYLKRAAQALTGTDASPGEKGWIMVKENITKDANGDEFDEQDSSVTRTDRNFRRIFAEAHLNVIKAEKQDHALLYSVMMYALRPS